MRAIISILKSCGVQNVPSLKTFRKMQKDLRSRLAVNSKRNVSPKGNVFYVNDMLKLIGEDLSNPLVREHLQFYPEERKPISQAWHADKWLKETELDRLTPMAISKKGEHFYVKEITRCKDGTLIYPVRWVIRNNTLTADSFKLEVSRVATFAQIG